MAESLQTVTGVSVPRVFTTPGTDPFETVEWENRDASIPGSKFEQKGVRVPKSWSDTALNITASKYFYGPLDGSGPREQGVDELFGRVVSTVSRWGEEGGYFATPEDADAFYAELSWLLLHQHAAFNSPVFFNAGLDQLDPENQAQSWHWNGTSVEYSPAGYSRPQCSACFIQSVVDSMEGIMELARNEAILFKYGSGTGTNLSPLRASTEHLTGGGVASGPLSFMRGYDSFAGAIKSGGKTRRAAKMVILNSDHPDIQEFIHCKGREEKKARALIAAGYDGASGPDSEAYASVSFQNANNSVRVTDEFMRLATGEEQGEYALKGRRDGRVIRTVSAEEMLRSIAEETWDCGDPGLQFDDTINKWHTCKVSGRINASNPCSEYMFLDDSACNLASLNLVKFLRKDGTFDVERYRAAVRIMLIAQEILVDNSGYPTEKIARNSHDYRPLGLGYANLGGLLLVMGLPYDSDKGRAIAGAVTAILGGQAYLTSAEIAAVMPQATIANSALVQKYAESGADPEAFPGSFAGYSLNRETFLDVIQMHLDAAEKLPEDLGTLREEAIGVWKRALMEGTEHGFRNAQVTVLAPTGTIGFMMDSGASTGVEPMIGLVAYKTLVGGGSITITNELVPMALERLGYSPAEVEQLVAWIAAHSTIEGAEGIKDEHLAIFDCAFKPASGTRAIAWEGHVKMMAAVQPFLSGAISKTVNMPKGSTAADIENAYIEAWRLGVKAIAIYRDGSKGGQPVSLDKVSSAAAVAAEPEDLNGPPRPNRRRLPEERGSVTRKFSIAGHEGYITVGLYPNGQPGEIFIKMAKEGSTISGLMDSFATSVSLGLQSGVPLKTFCDKYSHMRFEPSGWTGDEQIGYAKSIMDYIFRWLEMRFLKGEQLSMFAPPVVAAPPAAKVAVPEAPKSITDTLDFGDAPTCSNCGAVMVRNGSCFKCGECGGTSGCS